MSATALSTVGNDRIAMGGNLPPDVMAFNTIDAYYDEAKKWASDGFKIESQEQADAIDTLDKALLKAHQEADDLREAEKKPHDDASKAVQAKFNPYVQKDKGKTYIARASLKVLLTAWRVAQQAIKDAEARRIREEAEAAERAAQQAFQQTDVADIEQREEAERIANRAADLAKQSKRADKAATTNTGLRTSYVPVMTDLNAAIKHYWAEDRDSFAELVTELARGDVRRGKREIPGFRVDTVKGA